MHPTRHPWCRDLGLKGPSFLDNSPIFPAYIDIRTCSGLREVSCLSAQARGACERRTTMKRAMRVTVPVGMLAIILCLMPVRAGSDEADRAGCASLPSHAQLKAALDTAVLAETS